MRKLVLILLVSIFSFYGCKQSENDEKFIAEQKEIINKQKKQCLNELYRGRGYMEASNVLESLYIGFLNNNDKRIEKPGINTPFQEEKKYILMYNSPSKLIPNNPRYDDTLFVNLSQKNEDKPPVLLVRTKTLLKDSNEAVVTTSCSPKPFVVSLNHLYEIDQSKDSEVKSPTSGLDF